MHVHVLTSFYKLLDDMWINKVIIIIIIIIADFVQFLQCHSSGMGFLNY